MRLKSRVSRVFCVTLLVVLEGQEKIVFSAQFQRANPESAGRDRGGCGVFRESAAARAPVDDIPEAYYCAEESFAHIQRALSNTEEDFLRILQCSLVTVPN